MVMIICPDCGKEQDNLNKFCRNCGADLSKVEVVEDVSDSSQDLVSEVSDSSQELVNEVSDSSQNLEETVDVSNDLAKNEVLSQESNDLVDDNAVVNAEDMSDEVEVASVDKSEEVAVAPIVNPQEENILKCSDCGTELKPNVKFCPNCGKSTAGLNKSHSINFCPTCGTELAANVKFCPNCGTNLSHPTVKPKTTGAVVEQKTPFVSVLMSVLFPGLGQFYNGQNTKGLYFLIMAVVSWILCLIVIGVLLYILVWIWSIYDAYKSAEAINSGEILEDKLF